MTFRSPDPSALAPLLEEWLPQQRWFGGRGTATVTAIRVAGRLTDEPFVLSAVDEPSYHVVKSQKYGPVYSFAVSYKF